MLTPSQALAQILATIEPIGDVDEMPLTHAAGRVLAKPAVSDIDMPPFRRAMMDGFAVRSADFDGPKLDDGSIQLNCCGEAKAGAPFEGLVLPGNCIEIYTGAEVPDECDAVVMIERTSRQGNRVRLLDSARAGQHVQARADILAEGAQVLAPGRRLTPVDVSVLAAIGAHPVSVFRPVRVSILTTGDELVPAWVKPQKGQIREGNTLFLAHRCFELFHEVLEVGIVPDDEALLERDFGRALESSDALITTGGVSMGKYDLVGKTFEKLGVEPVLHKVAVKPGKPIWFGMRGPKPVLGLPGNPVSALLGLEAFVRPALARLGGETGAGTQERLRRAVWSGPARDAGDRQLNYPCRLEQDADGRERLVPLDWKGSADIVTVIHAEALAVLPADERVEEGQTIDYRPLGRG
ncbi:gephyrin-like molybdotransferase Glp [Engelhardtia mirabilis]|uniref:Molybdopterin molybdenumtransferase n=1 Tax=Engelhardtia mirabilis TaxID=2528011 RepID=A0A518BPY9_9BACT|nr:Molybdopterin molybdenumtransferase [Planctomycetes bacterium Pla133]QDV03361.1 Molybdopterin molybdenumtransferase [Planctomycetes bacterium Pla86]